MPASNAHNRMSDSRLIFLVLIVVTTAVFWRVTGFGFTDLDDGPFVEDNSAVQAGLTPQSIKWAFTSTWQSVWQPLTWLSYMLDRQIAVALSGSPDAGTGAGVYHSTNLVFHLANVLLLYALLVRVTGCRWRSAFVALLFAIHPLHVESAGLDSRTKGCAQ